MKLEIANGTKGEHVIKLWQSWYNFQLCKSETERKSLTSEEIDCVTRYITPVLPMSDTKCTHSVKVEKGNWF